MMMEKADLGVLSRAAPAGGAGPPPTADTHVPPPRFRWTTRVVLPGGMLLLAAGLLLVSARDALAPAVEVRVVPVVVRSAAPVDDAGPTIEAPGWIEPDPYPISVTALADGIVKEVLVLEGQSVAAGEVVARLVDADARLSLERAEADVGTAEAQLKAAEAAVVAAQRTWDHPVELTRKIATAEALFAERRAELDRWPAELETEKARLVELEADCARLTRLREQSLASDIESIRATQRCAAQRGIVDSITKRRPILEAQVRQMEAELEAARENLRLRIPETRALADARAERERAAAALRRAQTARDEARLRLERMEIRAPVAGIVMNRLVEPGSKVVLNTDQPRSTHVARLYDPARLQVRVDVPLADAGSVGVGQGAEVIASVLPERAFHGRATRVVHEADIQKNTIQVKVAVEDPAPQLKPEMLVRVRLFPHFGDDPAGAGPPAQTGEGSLWPTVPRVLVHGEGADAFVWLADQAANRAERRRVVAVAARSGDAVVVREGLRAGDRLIVEPSAGLRDGQRIRIAGEVSSEGGR